jgi:apolipoprotein N-acyltransferase
MARIRAIENRLWILRDTNDGVTSVIDPYGRVLLSTPRHQRNSLLAHFGFRDDVTFYSRFGDAFAMLCALVASASVISGGKRISRAYRQRFQVKGSN